MNTLRNFAKFVSGAPPATSSFYSVKLCRIEQSGLTDHLHKEVRHHQSFEQKLGNLRMVLIDQVVGGIIVNNICVQ